MMIKIQINQDCKRCRTLSHRFDKTKAQPSCTLIKEKTLQHWAKREIEKISQSTELNHK